MTSNTRKSLGRFGLGASTTTLAIGLAFAATPAFAQSTNAPTVPAAVASTPEQNAPATDTGGTIVVTGSRISNPNLTSITPVTVVNAAELKAQGNVRVEDLLNSLPQVFGSEGSSDANGASGIATVNLRNLGTNRTLVLVNGRRLGAGDPTDIASDLNFIPGSLIKRVDILTGGASATYGSDAVAGVVNFVLNTDFEGVQLDAQTSFYNHDNNYGNKDYNAALAAKNLTPPRGQTVDGAVKTATATFGASMADGRGHVTAYASWRQVNPVTQGDRDYSYCGYSAYSPGSFSCGGSSTSAFGRFTRTQQNGINPATGAPVYGAVPGFTSLTGNPAAPHAAGAFGNYSSTRDGYNFNPTNYFQRPDTRYTAGLFAHYDVADSFKPYLEFMFMDDHTRAQIAASGAFYGTDFFVNCNNPLLSGAQQTQLCGANAGTGTLQSVYIGRRNVEGGGRIDDLRHTDYRAVLGAKGDIADGITYDVYGSLWKSLLTEEYLNDFSRARLNNSLNVVTNAAGQPVCASTLPNAQGVVTDPNCVPYNIFSGTSTVQGNVRQGVTAAALNYLQTPGFQQGSNSEYIASGTVSIDLGRHGFQSPWADSGVQVVVGGEYRKEKIVLQRDIEFLTGDLAGQGTPNGVPNVSGGYSVKEGFTEVSIPLVTNKPFIETLGFVGGYRYSSYSIQGTTNTYKGQVEYAPVKQIRFRAGYNRAVRAPNSLELFAAPTVSLFAGLDPCAGAKPTATAAQCALTGVTAAQYGTVPINSAGQYNQQTVGNIALKPEKSDTFTAGVVVNPIRNLTISADFFDIKVKQAIGSAGSPYILANCVNGNNPALCSLIHRSSDGSLFTGPSFVANATLNLGSVKTQGVDVDGTYRLPLGSSSLTFNLVGTYLSKYIVQTFAGGSSFNCAGLFGLDCGNPLPKWRHSFRTTYQFANGLSVSGAWRFFGKTKNDQIVIEKQTLSDHDSRIPTVSYFDLSVAAALGDHYTFRVGAQNLLDKTPPVLDTNFTTNGSSTYAEVYDALGRYVYASIQVNF